jgi:hypothetical protein
MPVADPWNTETVETFEQLVAVVKPLMPSVSTENHLYWFRGQRDERWPLHSSFMRMLVGSSLPTDEIIRLEQYALREFRSKAHFFVNPALLGKVRTTPCWWALMQHHGAPTRLMDWTTSPYVAAYFAVSHYLSNEDGALWCFCSTTLHDAFVREYRVRPPVFEDNAAPQWYDERLDEFRNTDAVLPLSFNYASSERVLAQQGKFTMSFAPLQDHSALIEKLGGQFVKKIIIPSASKRGFLLRLRDINITAASLFPGVDGLGRSIEELISLGPVYGRATRIQTGRAADVPVTNSWCVLSTDDGTLAG